MRNAYCIIADSLLNAVIFLPRVHRADNIIYYCEFLFPLVIEVVGTKPSSLSLEIPPLDEDEEVKAILLCTV